MRLRAEWPEVHRSAAVTLHALGRHEEAVEAAKCAIELRKNYSEAHATLGSILHQFGEHEEALGAKYRVLELRSGDPEPHESIAVTLDKLGRHEEALAAKIRAIELSGGDPSEWLGYWDCCYELGRSEEALREVPWARSTEGATQQRNPDQTLERIRGIASRVRKKKQAELAATRRRLESLDCPEIYRSVGVTCWELGREDENRKAPKRALDFRGEFAERS